MEIQDIYLELELKNIMAHSWAILVWMRSNSYAVNEYKNQSEANA